MYRVSHSIYIYIHTSIIVIAIFFFLFFFFHPFVFFLNGSVGFYSVSRRVRYGPPKANAGGIIIIIRPERNNIIFIYIYIKKRSAVSSVFSAESYTKFVGGLSHCIITIAADAELRFVLFIIIFERPDGIL